MTGVGDRLLRRLGMLMRGGKKNMVKTEEKRIALCRIFFLWLMFLYRFGVYRVCVCVFFFFFFFNPVLGNE